MPTSANPTRFVFTGQREVHSESFERREMQPGQARVKAVCSLMSTGTENIVFNRLFAPGSHWDNWVKYPFYPGYLTIGRVIEVGSEVSNLKVGDLVGARRAHASEVIDDENALLPMPEGVDPEQLSWFGLAKIAFMGTQAAQYHIGDSVLIIGAGPVAQMAVRWAVASGAEHVIVADPIALRLEMAKRGGATHVIAESIDKCEPILREILGGNLPRVVVDSTGNAAVLPLALAVTQTHGRVVILGDTGNPGAQALTPDLITRGLTIVGAHDNLTQGEWDNARINRLFASLVTTGRFNLEGLTTHRFDPTKPEAAYAFANSNRGETMGIIFDWAGIS